MTGVMFGTLRRWVARVPWYIKLWAVLSLMAEAVFAPTNLRYNIQGYLGPPGSYPGFGGDSTWVAVLGAVWSPFVLILIMPVIWIIGTVTYDLFHR